MVVGFIFLFLFLLSCLRLGYSTLNSYCGVLVIAAGIVLFLLVEKVGRYVEDNSTGANAWNHGHHHHNHNSSKKLKDDGDAHDKTQSKSSKEGDGKGSDEVLDDSSNDTNFTQSESLLRKVILGNCIPFLFLHLQLIIDLP
jgi:hypothetical protein